MLLGIGIGVLLGMVNGTLVTVFRVPSIVATLGTLSIFRGIDYLIAGTPPGAARGPAARLHRPGPRHVLGIPIFVLLVVALAVVVGTVAPALDAVRAAGLRRRQQPRGRRDPGHPGPRRRLRRVHAVRPACRDRRRDVGHAVRDDQRHRRDRRRPRRRRRRRRRRRQHLRRQRHRHRRGDRRVLPGLRGQRAHPRRAVAVLAAGDLRRRDPPRGQRRRS